MMKVSIFAGNNKVMSAPLVVRSRTVFRVLILIVASMSLLTGCKSSRGSVKRGGAGQSTSAYDRWNREDYAKSINDPMGKALVSEAQGWIGTRYVYGGDSKSGTDCSGMVMRVYGQVCGIKIPRTTREQVRYCTKVARNKMQPGDLVFFAPGGSEDKVSHVGIYVGQGRMIHASSSRGVMVSAFDTGYWGDRYLTGARIDKAPKGFASLNKKYKTKDSTPAPVQETLPSVVPPPSVAPAPELQGAPEFPEVPSLPVVIGEEMEICDAGPQVVTAPTAQPDTLSAPTVSTIDLLDLIINQKVDSIFTSRFAD